MKKNIMRIASILILGIVSSPVFASVTAEVPTPGIMSLVGIGALAIYLINSTKK